MGDDNIEKATVDAAMVKLILDYNLNETKALEHIELSAPSPNARNTSPRKRK
jgi:hypothetical protein